jgi:outer membrane lipopolysaccharide assembly protein LptE/RlpB
MQKIFYALIIFCICNLSACDFRLRSAADLPATLHQLQFISDHPYETVSITLKKMLRSNGIQLHETSTGATAILHIVSEKFIQNVSGTSTFGSSQFTSITYCYTVVYTLADAKGKILIGPLTVAPAQTLQVNGNQMLGSQGQAEIIQAELARLACDQILNQLIAMRKFYVRSL